MSDEADGRIPAIGAKSQDEIEPPPDQLAIENKPADAGSPGQPATDKEPGAADTRQKPDDFLADRASGSASSEGHGAADPGVAADADSPDSAERLLDGDSANLGAQQRRLRADLPDSGADQISSSGQGRTTFNFGDGTSAENVTGRDSYQYFHYYNFTAQGGRARGPIGVRKLTKSARSYVETASDTSLMDRCSEDRVVFLTGRRESGRRSSAVHALDKLTGESRQESRVSVLEATTGLTGIAGRLAEGHGHLLDASAEEWLQTISEAQVSEIRVALEKGSGGYLIVIASADPPDFSVVEQQPPDPGRVLLSHIAVGLAGDADVTEEFRFAAEALLRDALEASQETRTWYEQIIGGTAGSTAPAEAVHLALAIGEWGEQRSAGRMSAPRVRHYQTLRHYRQAHVLLGRGDQSDSPLRQAHVIATAVLDGQAVTEVADGARQLAALLEDAEGGQRKRRVFAETLAHWLGHVDMAASIVEDDGVAVVQMRSRELARTIVEIAWLDYYSARVPLRSWLVRLCSEYEDPRIRIRAAQALSFIAVRDYQHIKSQVLDSWSGEDSKPIQHQAAAWLLEAAAKGDTTAGRVAGRVQELLWRWARSSQWQKRAIAVRAYGTKAVAQQPYAKVGIAPPEVAMVGIRWSAAKPDVITRWLPEKALRGLYEDGLHKPVLQELAFWNIAYPAMRERVGRALVLVSCVRCAEQGAPRGSYDLLWRIAHKPRTAGTDLTALAGLWKIACQQETSKRAAWTLLGLWAKGCGDDSAQRDAFIGLVTILEQQTGRDNDLRQRFRVYRRKWNTNLGLEEDQ